MHEFAEFATPANPTKMHFLQSRVSWKKKKEVFQTRLPLNEIKAAARTNHHNHKGLCKGQMIPEFPFIFF